MFNRIKRFLKSSNEVKKRGLQSIDNDVFCNARLKNKGSDVICLSINTFIDLMAKENPEWNNLFKASVDEKGNVVVSCLKGFANSMTKKAIPSLWRRKSFIENCTLFGVDKIVFIDSIEKTFDLLEIDKIDASKLPS